MEDIAILQSCVDEMSVALFHGDWRRDRSRVILPFTIFTETAALSATDESKLEEGFFSFHRMLLSQHVTDYVRLIESAEKIDPGLIAGRYISHYLSGCMRVISRFRSFITLRKVEETWRCVSIANSLRNMHWPLDMPLVTHDVYLMKDHE